MKISSNELNLDAMYNWNDVKDGECESKDICEYLHDVNHTIQSETWYEKIKDYKEGKHPKFRYANKLLADHILVHVSFASPKVEFNVLDAVCALQIHTIGCATFSI